MITFCGNYLLFSCKFSVKIGKDQNWPIREQYSEHVFFKLVTEKKHHHFQLKSFSNLSLSTIMPPIRNSKIHNHWHIVVPYSDPLKVQKFSIDTNIF